MGVSGELRYFGSPSSITLPAKPTTLPTLSQIGNMSLFLKRSWYLSSFFIERPASSSASFEKPFCAANEIKVFRIRNDVNQYQYFQNANESEWELLVTNCTPREKIWKPHEVFIYRPKHKRGHFSSNHLSFALHMPLMSSDIILRCLVSYCHYLRRMRYFSY